MKTKKTTVESVDTELDEIYDDYKDIDFSNAIPIREIPALAKLQDERAAKAGKTLISIRIDNDVLAGVKAKAKAAGRGYQSLINEAIRKGLLEDQIKDALREVLREDRAG
jgi:uncharacterized protein (DUF4415 family)